MERLRIQLTSSVLLRQGDHQVGSRELRSRQLRTTLAYLILNRSRRVSTEELRAVIWDETWPERWEVSLRSLLSQIRSSLRSLGQGVSVASEQGSHRLQFPQSTWVDLEEAVRSLERAEDAVRRNDPAGAHATASVAATILRRPFLSGVSTSWVTSRRDHHKRLLRRSLACLAESWLAHHQPALAIEAASEAVSLDRTAETGYNLLIRANTQMGNSAEAVRWYNRLRRALSSELGLSPSEEAEKLFLQVLRHEHDV